MVREDLHLGKAGSMVAHQHSVNPNQLFQWRKPYKDGSL
jgi:transposase-like protein